MREGRVYELKQTNKEQRETIDELKETIKRIKQQDLETRLSLYYKFVKLSDIGHSDNIYKNIEMLKIVDATIKEMDEDLKIDLFLENDEEGKIIELVNEYESKH